MKRWGAESVLWCWTLPFWVPPCKPAAVPPSHMWAATNSTAAAARDDLDFVLSIEFQIRWTPANHRPEPGSVWVFTLSAHKLCTFQNVLLAQLLCRETTNMSSPKTCKELRLPVSSSKSVPTLVLSCSDYCQSLHAMRRAGTICNKIHMRISM